MNPNLSRISGSVFKTQNGMVLLFCLIFLTALTLLGLSASADTVLQNKLATNLQETEHAKQSALSALAWAEKWLLELEGPVPETCTEPCDGLYIHVAGNLPSHPEFKNISWWLDQGYEAGIDPLSGNQVATISNGSIYTPVWIIESIHEIPPAENQTTDLQVWYRILAHGSGRTGAGISVVESIVVRSWPAIANAEPTETGISGSCPDSVPTTKCGRVSWRELR